ncbi:hypothetical protein [Polyangium jinanense]|uniref:Uncharacterized protein n=1 Tax=Polyangium jinanense TaxID=2829994 RepID=A0A9X3X7J6_9BACT|nr:hypothetical protein [Polyangium jinanense]MDC3959953.1 hypothetical protein [Polyangium jinanense]MDC3983833.1 hypothetical protein [Polyangium jinanense]
MREATSAGAARYGPTRRGSTMRMHMRPVESQRFPQVLGAFAFAALATTTWVSGCAGRDDATASSASSNSNSGTTTHSRHGDDFTIHGTGFGAKVDSNAGDHRFLGKRHLVARFSDFDNATSAEPAENTKEGWRAHLDGIYPILTSTDFNAAATASGATLELSGGPTRSGRWLQRRITQEIRDAYPQNYRLRNWNLWDTNEYHPQMYLSCYVNLSTTEEPGKYFRFYWTDSSVINHNVWTALQGSTLTARAEGSNDGMPGIYADPPASYQDNTWIRYEILADFENDVISFYANGQMLKDASRGYTGEISGWLGTGGKIDYFLLSNTVDMDGDAGEFLGHAMPYLDFSFERIELADAPVWENRTQSVIQVPTRWTDTEIDIVVNQGTFADLSDKHLFLLKGMTATYLGPLP